MKIAEKLLFLLEDTHAMRQWLDGKGIAPEQYSKDRKNGPTDREVYHAYKYFKKNPPPEEIT